MSGGSTSRRIVTLLRAAADAFVRSSRRTAKPPRRAGSTRPLGGPRTPVAVDEGSPGQFGSAATRDLTPAELRRLRPSYAPAADGAPDPGEIVWTWVPYVENDGRGKDRPVLIIARLDADATAGCYLSTKEHHGFVSVGSGPWDSRGRESFLAPDRVLRVTTAGMRREGNVLPRERFERAADTVSRTHDLGWA